MKKILSLAILATIISFAVSCQKETLEPTNIEKDWAKNIDLSNSYVKQLYEKTGVAILTEFSDTADVFYQGSDVGVTTNFKIKHIEKENKDMAIEWLKTNILDCFSTECIKKYFPRRIFLVKQIDAPGSNPSWAGAWIQELKYVNNLWSATGAQHAFAFAQGWAIAVDTDLLCNSETQIDYNTQYRVDQMTLICDELFMKNDWIEGIRNNIDIFPDKVTSLYGEKSETRQAQGRYVKDYTTTLNGIKYVKTGDEGMWRMWYGCDVFDPDNGDELAKVDNTKMSLTNYFKFGFPDNGQNDNQAYGSLAFKWTETTWSAKNAITGVTETMTANGYASLSSTYGLNSPIGIYRDSRNLICALADLKPIKLDFYGEFLIQRLYVMSEYLRSYGIDFTKFNDTINEMYAMHKASSNE